MNDQFGRSTEDHEKSKLKGSSEVRKSEFLRRSSSDVPIMKPCIPFHVHSIDLLLRPLSVTEFQGPLSSPSLSKGAKK